METTVTLTSRGVVTLPAKLRQALGLQADDQLIAETTPRGLAVAARGHACGRALFARTGT